MDSDSGSEGELGAIRLPVGEDFSRSGSPVGCGNDLDTSFKSGCFTSHTISETEV